MSNQEIKAFQAGLKAALPPKPEPEIKGSLFQTGIRPAIDAHLLKLSEELRDYGDYWSASQAGYCYRKVIFDRLGIPPVEPDARKQRVFSSGHIFHEWIQDITKQTGLSIAQEVELQDEDLMIRGHFDDLVLVQDWAAEGVKPDEPKPPTIHAHNQHLILYDYKTAHSRSFTYSKDRPMSRYHRYQLGTYMYMLRSDTAKFKEDIFMVPTGFLWTEWRPKLTEARILTISKDDLRMAEKQLLWSPELEKEIKEWWTKLNEYWNDKKLPPCTCADHEKNTKTGKGFMADSRYNPYYYDGEPCSVKWFAKHPELVNKWKEQ